MGDLPMTREELRKALSELPPGGWWHAANEEKFQELAARLILAGLSPERTYDILAVAYGAVIDEHGN